MDIDIYGNKWPFFSTSVSAFRMMKKMNLRLLSISVMVLCGVDGLLQGKVIQSSSLHNSPVEDQPEVPPRPISTLDWDFVRFPHGIKLL